MPPAPSPLKDGRLAHWLTRQGYAPSRLQPLAGDVSMRSYWRLTSSGRRFIVALYPAAIRRSCKRFRITDGLLRRAGVRVPEILACDCRRGFMVLEDVGPRTLYDRRGRPWRELRPQLEAAVATARRIASLPPRAAAGLNPPLDRALLERELEQTFDAFLLPRGLAGDEPTTAVLRSSLSRLCQLLADEPRVVCHRDFMARNLMPVGGGLAVLDHQDLRLGPLFYDLASLVNDSLFPPPELVAELIGADAEEPGYRRAAAQRALKAVGTFAAFAARGNRRHLALVPPTLGRALDHLLRIPETAEIAGRVAGGWRAIC